MLHITPLGIGSALPSTDYHFSSTAAETESQLFLFDCGEGTQVRFLEAGLRPSRLRGIFITHLHGDHYFGLPGLLSTLSLLKHPHPLSIVGPVGLRDFLDALPSRSPENELPFPIEFVELDSPLQAETVFESDQCRVLAHSIEHSVFTAGYRFEEKDRPGNLDVERAQELGVDDFNDYRRLKEGHAVTLPDGRIVHPNEVVSPVQPGSSFAYVTDSRPCEGGIALARNADLLYHEATFLEEDHSRAHQTKHSTAREAAGVALEAGAKKLLIGHFSARYKEAGQLVAEAREVFQNTEAAEELKRYAL